MKIEYESKNFRAATLEIIHQADSIITEYTKAKYDLTLRQLYYQFVSRDLLPNTQSNYKKLASIISDARKAGLIDWDAIVDRTRAVEKVSTWENAAELITECSNYFKFDPWIDQETYVEVWFEKDALEGVFSRACKKFRVPYLSCRGYCSDSEMFQSAQRFIAKEDKEDRIILYMGDHDPSGMHMSKDIENRLNLFCGAELCPQVRRLGLDLKQVKQYKLPPNPAKDEDPRFSDYKKTYGDQSWELDALDPKVIVKLVQDSLSNLVDQNAYDKVIEQEKEEKAFLEYLAGNYDDIRGNWDGN